MTLNITARAIVWNTTAGNKTTPSFTPDANDQLVAIVGLAGVDGAPTMSDSLGGSWTLVDSFRSNNSGGGGGLRTYVRDTAAPASSMTVTMTSPGGDFGGGVAVLSVGGLLRFGSVVVRATGGLADQTAGTTAAPVLGVTPLSTSAVIVAVMDQTNGSANSAPRSGYTEHYDQGFNSPATGIEVQSVDSGETSATITLGATTPSQYAAIALEVTSESITTYADDFERASLGANWASPTTDDGDPTIVSSHYLGLIAGTGTGTYTVALWAPAGKRGNCYSEATIKPSHDTTMQYQVAVRRDATLDQRYGFHYNPAVPQWELKLDGAGATSVLASRNDKAAPADGDVLRIEARGSLLKGYVNGEFYLSAVDTTLPTGNIGVTIAKGSATLPAAAFESWAGGDLALSLVLPPQRTQRNLLLSR